jgi:hypothetical protein
MMEEHQWSPEQLQALALLGLEITPHSDPANGWGDTWQGRDWSGQFPTPDAAIHAAFTESLQALLFRNEYSWVLSAQPGEHRQFNGERWLQIDGPQKRGSS